MASERVNREEYETRVCERLNDIRMKIKKGTSVHDIVTILDPQPNSMHRILSKTETKVQVLQKTTHRILGARYCTAKWVTMKNAPKSHTCDI